MTKLFERPQVKFYDPFLVWSGVDDDREGMLDEWKAQYLDEDRQKIWDIVKEGKKLSFLHRAIAIPRYFYPVITLTVLEILFPEMSLCAATTALCAIQIGIVTKFLIKLADAIGIVAALKLEEKYDSTQ